MKRKGDADKIENQAFSSVNLNPTVLRYYPGATILNRRLCCRKMELQNGYLDFYCNDAFCVVWLDRLDGKKADPTSACGDR